MRDVHEYVDLAKKRSGFNSERKLCAALGTSPNTINGYRRGTLPSDETMVKLANLAGVDTERALLDLNMWRSAGTPAQQAYAGILQKLAHLAPAIALLITVIAPFNAANASPTLSNDKVDCIYYGK